jgi:CheY-like chemotaxis protein
LVFDCVVVPSAPAIVGDAAGLEQVLSNLLQNACQATPRGGKVSLTVQVRGRLLEFVVRDNGPGIPSEIIPYIFEPFYSTKPDHEGTGLGLSISQGIVRNHNGILTAENIPDAEGGGARFVVAMPFDDRRWRDRTAGPEVQAQVTAGDHRPAPSGRRVLVAEDDVTVRQAVHRFLEHTGWHVTEVEDGRAALAILLPEEGEAPFDAVVCDLHLPGVSGVVVYGRVCAESSRLRDRFLLMTGDGTNPVVTSFQERTHAEVLEKPFELEVLAETLERMVLR